MLYPSASMLTPRSNEKNTTYLIREFLKGKISSSALNDNGIPARTEGAARIAVIKNPSNRILKFAEKEGLRLYPSYRFPGAIEIVSNTI